MNRSMEMPPNQDASWQEGAVEAARLRMEEAVVKWRSRYFRGVTAAVVTLVGLQAMKTEDSREGVKEVAELWSPDLQRLDPEITEERFVALMNTLPEGCVTGRVSAIRYTDQERPADPGDGLPGWVTLATAADDGEANLMEDPAPTLITFYGDARKLPSREIWNVALHEIGHACHWDKDPMFWRVASSDLDAAFEARLDAPDRFRSEYVESIRNDDKNKERSRKRAEYFADGFAAWLGGEPMSSVDEALFEALVRQRDPKFSRDAMLTRRNAILDPMEREEGGGRPAPALAVGASSGKLADWTYAPEP